MVYESKPQPVKVFQFTGGEENGRDAVEFLRKNGIEARWQKTVRLAKDGKPREQDGSTIEMEYVIAETGSASIDHYLVIEQDAWLRIYNPEEFDRHFREVTV